eukprot:218140-Pelagomonas_calceolata.AAC.1
MGLELSGQRSNSIVTLYSNLVWKGGAQSRGTEVGMSPRSSKKNVKGKVVKGREQHSGRGRSGTDGASTSCSWPEGRAPD